MASFRTKTTSTARQHGDTSNGKGGLGVAHDEGTEHMAKRANGEGTIGQRSDGRWQGRVSLPHGARKSVYGATQAEVRQKVKDLIRAHEDGVDVTARRETVAAYLDRWLADAVKPKNAPKTYSSYSETVRVHIVPSLGRIQLARLTGADVAGLLRTKSDAGLSPRTVAYIRAVLRSALNRAIRWGVIGKNPVLMTDAPKQVRTEVRPWTPEQARTFLTAAGGDRLETLYRLALSLGLRMGEALGLRWSDVDLVVGELRVRQAIQRVDGKLSIVGLKTEKSRRTVAMPATLVRSLTQHRDRQAFERAVAGSSWSDSGLVFTNGIGTALEPSNVLQRFKALSRRAGVPEQKFHALRHGAATLMLAQGVPLKVAADILGHSQLATTADLYAHVLPAQHRAAADLMETILTGTDA